MAGIMVDQEGVPGTIREETTPELANSVVLRKRRCEICDDYWKAVTGKLKFAITASSRDKDDRMITIHAHVF